MPEQIPDDDVCPYCDWICMNCGCCKCTGCRPCYECMNNQCDCVCGEEYEEAWDHDFEAEPHGHEYMEEVDE